MHTKSSYFNSISVKENYSFWKDIPDLENISLPTFDSDNVIELDDDLNIFD